MLLAACFSRGTISATLSSVNLVKGAATLIVPITVAARLTGFLRGRRYVAEHGTPEYFTLYEAASASVLTGPAYLERLNSPTPWTKTSTADFRNTVRGVCQTQYSHERASCRNHCNW
jgi:hypothetical protein